ncbi:hypothetical protein Z043_123656 [Scleropages formosus]|uniref:U1-type domain-containing protein n=1 Tax=Scleropages formosus TaxID=113540 RepID=A0A0P7TCK8_SCLFO|nr:hypothetical protein Z043_123656 [Scleropages formosus]
MTELLPPCGCVAELVGPPPEALSAAEGRLQLMKMRMRRPCSSAQLAEDGWCQEGRGWGSDTQKSERPEGPEGPERTSRREKKHNKYMLCEVCNVQLNSLAQAQIHYNGKSHQKKLKQMSSGKQRGNVGLAGPSDAPRVCRRFRPMGLLDRGPIETPRVSFSAVSGARFAPWKVRSCRFKTETKSSPVGATN